jgi:aryl-alcohol dehydrogenase-like predicted oxidoreductase
MRYRPLGVSALSVSAVTLKLTDLDDDLNARQWRDLILAALEAGINSFEIDGPSLALLTGAAEAFAGMERRLLFIALRAHAAGPLGYSTQDMANLIRRVLKHGGVGHLDLVSLDRPAIGPLTTKAVDLLKDAKAAGIIRRIGVAGDDEAIETLTASGAFDVLVHPFSLSSGWRERHRIKAAVSRGMGVIATESFNAALAESVKAPKRQLSSFWRRRSDPMSGQGAFEFLSQTPGWTAEEICLAFSLTEPAVASVVIEPNTSDRLAELAGIPDRDLPTALSAQIEMARFSPPPESGERRRA